jgi:hypothetical protein
MTLEIDGLLGQLRSHDVDAETARRIRGKAHAQFVQAPSAFSRAYNRVLEPVLIVATIVASVSWMVDRIRLLAR